MLPKKQKITGKDVQYILRRGKKWHGSLLTFSSVPQYSNRNFSQWGIHVGRKFQKQAVVRNILKRDFYALIGQYLVSIPVHKKVFIHLNKKFLSVHTQAVASFSKKDILVYWKEASKKDFTAFLQSIGVKMTKS